MGGARARARGAGHAARAGPRGGAAAAARLDAAAGAHAAARAGAAGHACNARACQAHARGRARHRGSRHRRRGRHGAAVEAGASARRPERERRGRRQAGRRTRQARDPGAAPADAKPANGSDKPAEGAEEKPAEDKDKEPAAASGVRGPPARAAEPGAVRRPAPAPAVAATPAAARGAGPPKPPPPSQTRFQRPGVTSRHSPQETAILPPRQGKRDGMNARYIAIGLVGLLVLGGAAVFGVTQLTGDDDGGTASSQTASDDSGSTDGQSQPKQRSGGAVKPGSVTVAVLNGTTVPGLAATLSDEISAAGFKVGTITNFSDQQLAESVVQYASGHEAEARAVSRKLGITQREPVNPSSQALAGDATVIVIAGADKSP